VLRLWLRTRCDKSDDVEVLPSPELFAYTLPGAAGHIVMSQGLLDELDDVQFSVVLAHERAHGSLRHDRFVILGAITVALVPLLEPVRRCLRFALERWADEVTVSELSVERNVVARTLATVALGTAAVPRGATGVAGVGVAGRVSALLDPPPIRKSPLVLSAVGVVATLAAAAVQTHHLAPLLAVLCQG